MFSVLPHKGFSHNMKDFYHTSTFTTLLYLLFYFQIIVASTFHNMTYLQFLQVCHTYLIDTMANFIIIYKIKSIYVLHFVLRIPWSNTTCIMLYHRTKLSNKAQCINTLNFINYYIHATISMKATKLIVVNTCMYLINQTCTNQICSLQSIWIHWITSPNPFSGHEKKMHGQ